MADFITIKDLKTTTELKDNNRVLVDDTEGSDTNTVFLSVLREYLTKNIKPSIDAVTGNWLIGNTDTGISAKQIDFDTFLDSVTIASNPDSSQKKMKFDVILSAVKDNLLEIKEDGLYAITPEMEIPDAEITAMIDELWNITNTANGGN